IRRKSEEAMTALKPPGLGRIISRGVLKAPPSYLISIRSPIRALTPEERCPLAEAQSLGPARGVNACNAQALPCLRLGHAQDQGQHVGQLLAPGLEEGPGEAKERFQLVPGQGGLGIGSDAQQRRGDLGYRKEGFRGDGERNLRPPVDPYRQGRQAPAAGG